MFSFKKSLIHVYCPIGVDNGVTLIRIYGNDCPVIGNETQSTKLTIDLKEGGFNLKVTNHLTDYLSCRILENESKNEILILQPHPINNLRDKFEEEVVQKRVYKSPGTPRFIVVCPGELQERYCKKNGVGMLLYLTKYSQPDLCIIVRELSKCMDEARVGTYHEMLRVVRFVLC